MRLLVVLYLVANSAIAVADPDWSPLDDGGWPKGESIATLRHLPPCTSALRAEPGAPIPCRPPAVDDAAHIAYSMDWTSGIAFGSDRTTGGMQAWGNELLYAATRSIQLGLRYEMTGVSTPLEMTGPADGFGHQVFGVARYRYFVDEVDRSAWTLGAGIGQAFRKQALGGNAPIARLSLAREIGMFLDDDNALTMALELAYETSLVADTSETRDPRDPATAGVLQAVTASAKFGFETNIREPLNLGHPERPLPGYVMRGGWLVGNSIGLDLSVDVGRGALGLATTLGYLTGHSKFVEQHGFEGAQWSVMSGPRYGNLFYVQAQAGAAWVPSQTGAEVRGIGQAEIGISPACIGELGFWLRNDLDDGGITAGGFVLRLVYSSRPRARVRCQRGDGGRPAFATEPPPPPPPAPPAQPEPPPRREIIVERIPEAPPPGPRVEVHVEVKPIVIEIDLGVSLGGFVDVQIDPRILPLDRLRGAGYITVELSGPSAALARFEGRLRGTLRRTGMQIDAWSAIATSASTVRARFTIWPPGSRP